MLRHWTSQVTASLRKLSGNFRHIRCHENVRKLAKSRKNAWFGKYQVKILAGQTVVWKFSLEQSHLMP